MEWALLSAQELVRRSAKPWELPSGTLLVQPWVLQLVMQWVSQWAMQ
jgi:hypothetical protein